VVAAIQVEDLGKRYRIDHERRRGGYRTLRESLADIVAAPLRRWRNGKRSVDSEDFWALKDVGFQVAPGEVVGIIGRNGAGKSTLLKILSRITRPTTGKVRLRGRVGSLLEVGTGFHPELTGRENVYLNGAILGMSRREIDRKFDDIAAFAEIDQFLDTPVKRYSSGMYVRLAFAVAAHLEPEILLVDEVLAVGDSAFQKKCLGRMKSIGHGDRAVLFVSHNMAAVLSLCNRALLVQDGCIQSDGHVASVVEEYVKTLASPAGGRLNLQNHPARLSGHLPLLVGVRLTNENGETTATFGCGEALTIALDLQPVRPLDRPQVGIGFDDAMGQRVFSVATYLSDSCLPSLNKPMTVYCRIPALDIAPGTYTLSLSAGCAGDYLMDELANAVALEVTATDFYGNGRLPTAGLGHVLVKSRWGYINGDHDDAPLRTLVSATA
jgi:homopolymeric O-antigen transport system ATP-binding protein